MEVQKDPLPINRPIIPVSVLLTLIMGIIMSAALFTTVKGFEQREVELEFMSAANQRYTILQRHLVSDFLIIESIVGLYNASYDVERQEFANFVEPFFKEHREILALVWVQEIKGTDRSFYEQMMKNKGFQNFEIREIIHPGKIVTAGNRDRYFPICFIEPYKNNNAILGYDLSSHDIIHRVISQAIDSGKITATPVIMLPLIPQDNTTFLLIKPVFTKDRTVTSVEALRNNLMGMVIGIFSVRDCIEEALSRMVPIGINIYVYDETNPMQNPLLHAHISRLDKNKISKKNNDIPRKGSPLFIEKNLDIGGRLWKLLFTPAQKSIFTEKSWYSWSILVFCLMLTLSLSIYLILNNNKNIKLTAINEEVKREVVKRQGIEKDLRKSTHDLNEHIKELNYLYGISSIFEKYGDSLEDIFQHIVNHVKNALRYPEITHVRITFRDQIFETAGFRTTELKQTADIVIGSTPEGWMEVFYQNDKKKNSGEPNTLGETKLINTVIKRLESFIKTFLAQKEKKHLETQLIHSEKMASIGQLAAGVAHEINNPIGFVSSNLNTLSDYLTDIHTLITTYSELTTKLPGLCNNSPSLESLKKSINNISNLEKRMDIDFILTDVNNLVNESKDGIHRIRQIINDLKTYAHPGGKSASYENVNKCLESTLNIVWNELKYKANVVKNYGEIPEIECFPQELNQVFMNLLVNAAQAIKDKGEIRINTRTIDESIEVRISDNGKGIPKEHLPKIFDPFFTTKEVGKGTGLGLNVTYNIIKKHKGTIQVQSDVNKGTTFIIKLKVNPGLSESRKPDNQENPMQDFATKAT